MRVRSPTGHEDTHCVQRYRGPVVKLLAIENLSAATPALQNTSEIHRLARADGSSITNQPPSRSASCERSSPPRQPPTPPRPADRSCCHSDQRRRQSCAAHKRRSSNSRDGAVQRPDLARGGSARPRLCGLDLDRDIRGDRRGRSGLLDRHRPGFRGLAELPVATGPPGRGRVRDLELFRSPPQRPLLVHDTGGQQRRSRGVNRGLALGHENLRGAR